MYFNKRVEKFFKAKLSFIPFLWVPKEWYDQQVAKKGLIPKEMRPPAETEFILHNGEKSPKTESSGLVDGNPESNRNLEAIGPNNVGIIFMLSRLLENFQNSLLPYLEIYLSDIIYFRFPN